MNMISTYSPRITNTVLLFSLHFQRI